MLEWYLHTIYFVFDFNNTEAMLQCYLHTIGFIFNFISVWKVAPHIFSPFFDFNKFLFLLDFIELFLCSKGCEFHLHSPLKNILRCPQKTVLDLNLCILCELCIFFREDSVVLSSIRLLFRAYLLDSDNV